MHGRTDTGHRHGSNGWRPVGSSQRAALPGAQAQDVRTEQLPSCLLCSVSAALVAAASCPLSSRAVDGAGTPGRPEQEAVCGRASEAVYLWLHATRQQEWMQRQAAGCGGASPVFAPAVVTCMCIVHPWIMFNACLVQG